MSQEFTTARMLEIIGSRFEQLQSSVTQLRGDQLSKAATIARLEQRLAVARKVALEEASDLCLLGWEGPFPTEALVCHSNIRELADKPAPEDADGN